MCTCLLIICKHASTVLVLVWEQYALDTYIQCLKLVLPPSKGTNYQPFINQDSCKILATCGSQQYQTATPTTTSDRVCANTSTCWAGTFSLTPSTPTSNRVCANCSQSKLWTVSHKHIRAAFQALVTISHLDIRFNFLSAFLCFIFLVISFVFLDEYQDQANQTSCKVAVKCLNSTQFQSMAHTATSNTVCVNLTTCSAGQYIASNSTATTDRICGHCVAGQLVSIFRILLCYIYELKLRQTLKKTIHLPSLLFSLFLSFSPSPHLSFFLSLYISLSFSRFLYLFFSHLVMHSPILPPLSLKLNRQQFSDHGECSILFSIDHM